MARSILLTRPTKQSKYFAQQLTKIGVKEPILIAPLMSIIFRENYKINFREIKKFIVTSANAIEGVNANRILSSPRTEVEIITIKQIKKKFFINFIC